VNDSFHGMLYGFKAAGSVQAAHGVSGSDAALPVLVRILPGTLTWEGDDGLHGEIRVREARFKVGGFGGKMLEVSFTSRDNQPCTLYLTEGREAAQALLTQGLPAEDAARLAKIAGGQATVNRALIITGILAVLFFGGYYGFGYLWGRAMDGALKALPVSAEVQLGETLASQVLSTNKVCSDPGANQQVQAVLDRLTAKLPADEKLAYRVFVSDSPDLNAFALPGGFVFVNLGLLTELDNADQLAGVLAHEIQHVRKRHGLKNLAARAGLGVAVAVLFGDLGGLGGLAVEGAYQMAGLSFTRTQEREADALGVELLAAANYNPAAMPDFFKKIQKKEEDATFKAPAFLSSHPDTAERIANLEKWVSQNSERNPDRKGGGGPALFESFPVPTDCRPVSSLDPKRDAKEFGAATPSETPSETPTETKPRTK
jgi:Zn-dependent protease with chaperone function